MNEPKPDASAHAAEDDAALERQRALSRQLRAMFDDVVGEDLPDEFQALIDKLQDEEPR